MKSRLLSFWMAAASLLAWPVMALAQPEEIEVLDARLENYGQVVTLESHSPVISWILLIFLALVCLATMFRNSRRTHLD